MKDEARQTELHAKKLSVIWKRFMCRKVIPLNLRKPYMYIIVDRAVTTWTCDNHRTTTSCYFLGFAIVYLFLVCWMQWFKIWRGRYLLCRNDTRFWCARKERQHFDDSFYFFALIFFIANHFFLIYHDPFMS